MLQKLKNLIEQGGDIEFSLNGRYYTILPWTEDGIVIGQQNADDDMAFSSVEELIDGYLVDNKPLRSYVDQIIITFAS